MSIWKRIWWYLKQDFHLSFAAWERPDMMGSAVAAATALAVALLGLIGVKVSLDPNVHSYWLWGTGTWLFALLIIITPFRIWLRERLEVEKHLKAAEPKVSISTPLQRTDPKEVKGKCFRTWSLKIENISTTALTGCVLKQTHLVNARGADSDSNGLHFKLSTEKPVAIANFTYHESFELNPKTSKTLDIACLNEWTVDDPNCRVWMYYAPREAARAEIKAGLPFDKFPHRLTVEFSAAQLVVPVTVTVDLILHNGMLKMERVQ